MNSQEREKGAAPLILRYVSGLRFPWVFGLVAIVFGVDLIFPDVLPFVDELLLGLLTLLLGAWRKRKDDRAVPLPLRSTSTEAAATPALPPPTGNITTAPPSAAPSQEPTASP